MGGEVNSEKDKIFAFLLLVKIRFNIWKVGGCFINNTVLHFLVISIYVNVLY